MPLCSAHTARPHRTFRPLEISPYSWPIRFDLTHGSMNFQPTSLHILGGTIHRFCKISESNMRDEDEHYEVSSASCTPSSHRHHEITKDMDSPHTWSAKITLRWANKTEPKEFRQDSVQKWTRKTQYVELFSRSKGIIPCVIYEFRSFTNRSVKFLKGHEVNKCCVKEHLKELGYHIRRGAGIGKRNLKWKNLSAFQPRKKSKKFPKAPKFCFAKRFRLTTPSKELNLYFQLLYLHKNFGESWQTPSNVIPYRTWVGLQTDRHKMSVCLSDKHRKFCSATTALLRYFKVA